VAFGNRWPSKTGITALCLLLRSGRGRSPWHDGKKRYGKVNEHNACIPRDHWLTEVEKKAILGFPDRHPLGGVGG
jgi:hypothetical protein